MFVDISKDLEVKSSQIRVGPKSKDKSFYRKRKRTDTDTERKSHMKTEAEIVVMHLRAREHQGTPRNTSSHQQLVEARKHSPLSLQRKPSQHLNFGILASRTVRTDLLFQAT